MENTGMILLDQPTTKDHLIDLFCGCGGSGGGLLEANKILKRDVQGLFVNHWDAAIDIHTENHPEHRHLLEDLFTLDPKTVSLPSPGCSLLWASPSCTNFSLAKGNLNVTAQGRSHAYSVLDWIDHIQPDCLIVENVKEFLSWGGTIQRRRKAKRGKGDLMWAKNGRSVKLLPNGHGRRRSPRESEEDWSARMVGMGYEPYLTADPDRKGEYFQAWAQDIRDKGYKIEWRELRSCDYGDPTIRTRLFVQAVRLDCGKEIVWPEPTHDKDGEVPGKVWAWPSTRDHVIDWSLKGDSVFTRKKPLAGNTFRRLAIGLVKYGLKDYLVPNFGERPTQTPRSHSLDEPLPTVTSHGAGGLVQPSIIQMKGETFILPKDAGHQQDYVRSVDDPLQALTTKAHEVVVEPLIDHLRGTGVAKPVSDPLSTITSGGQHQALAEAFMMSIDQTGGKKRNHGCCGVDEPTRPLVTKANQSCAEFDLEEVSDKFLQACDEKGVDASRATTFLNFLVAELHRKGRLDAKPWIYVYYSSGSEGSDIDRPLPTCRTKAGHALVYPVVELEGKLLRIDLFYRMLTTLELQRAMGFPDNMRWAGKNKTQQIRAIGNSVSHGIARALGLAWYSQQSNTRPFVQHLYGNNNQHTQDSV